MHNLALSPSDIQALWITFKLATVVLIILLVVGSAIAWWLAHTKSRLRGMVLAIVALPLVLPPTVLGFYFLLTFGANSYVGSFLANLGFAPLPFTFNGLVVASVFYSLPFMVQPLYSGFKLIGEKPLESAATLGASRLDAFFSVIIPQALPQYLTAMIMTFAHTVGEFGVVLMVGGNIAGETTLVSVQIYDYVESFDYGGANRLSAILLIFTFIVLLAVNYWQPKYLQGDSFAR